MIDDCAALRFSLTLLRRNELEPAEAERVRRHVTSCPECTAELAAEQQLDRELAAARAATAPPELREAVQALLRRERSSGERAWWPAARRWVARPLVSAALGAAAAAVVVGVVPLALLRPRPEPALSGPLAEAVAGYRQTALQRDVLGLAAEDVERAASALRQRYGLPTTTAFRGDAELRLVAVRPTVVLGRTGAILVFADGAGRLVTLQIVRAPEVSIPRDETTQVETFRPLLTERDHLTIALWKQADALYTLSAEADRTELARLFIKVRRGTSNPS